MSDIYFKKNRRSKSQGKQLNVVNDTCQPQREHALICHGTRKWNWNERQKYSPGVVVQPGSPGHRNTDWTSLQMQQWCRGANWASTLALTDPSPYTLYKSLYAIKCRDRLIGKYGIGLLKKILADEKGILAPFNLDIEHQAPCALTLTYNGKSRRRSEDT